MAVGPFIFTDPGALAVRKNQIIPETDTMVAILVDNAHTPSVITDDLYSDVSANECTDTDYTTNFPNGLVLTSVAWTSPLTRVMQLDWADLDFGNTVTISARYVYILRRAGASLVAGDLIMGYIDLNDGGSTNVSSTNGDFDLAMAATGAYRETLSP